MRLLPLLLATVLLPGLAAAAETRAISCRFLGFGTAEPVELTALGGEAADAACTVPSGSLSPPVSCTAVDGTLTFVAGADKKPAASVSVPAGVSSVILIFLPSGKPAPGAAWRTMMIQDNAKSFPEGGAYVANLNTADIRFIIGEHKGTLHPGGAHGYPMPKERNTFNMATVIFEVQNGEKWRKANESALRFLPGMRYLILAYTDPRTNRPRISTVQDFLSLKPVKPAAPAN